MLKPARGIQINRSHPLSRDIAACWLMHENGGDIINDFSGNGIVGSFNNTVYFAPGKFGGSVYLDGSSDYIDLGTPNILESSVAFSLVAWIKPTATGSYEIIFSKNNGADRIGVHSGGLMIFYLDGVFAWVAGITANLFDGNWHQVAYIYDSNISSNNMRVYVDGLLESATTQAGLITTGYTASAKIGCVAWSPGTYNFEGYIDNQIIWNRGLKDSDVMDLYRNPFAMFDRGIRPGIIAA